MEIEIQQAISIAPNRITRLPIVHSFEMANIDDIHSISIGPLTLPEREHLLNSFPKSYKPKRLFGHAYNADKSIDLSRPLYYVFFTFQTLFQTGVTGEKNESAIKRREKVIARIKTLPDLR